MGDKDAPPIRWEPLKDNPTGPDYIHCGRCKGEVFLIYIDPVTDEEVWKCHTCGLEYA